MKIKRRGKNHGKYVHDGADGDRERSLRVALEYRDRLLLRLGPALRVSRHDVRNKTGVVGVHEDWARAGGRVARSFRASFPDGRGRTERPAFSVAKYGEERALELAIRARREGLRRLAALKRSELELDVERRRRRR